MFLRPLFVGASSGPVPIWSLDFTGYTPGGIATPAGLTFTRPAHTGSTQTVQTSRSTVVKLGEAANVLRIGQFGDDALSRGAVIEQQTLSLMSYPLSLTFWDAFTPSSGMTATSGFADPIGESNGWRCQLVDGGFSGGQSSSGGYRTFSMYARASSGTKRQTTKNSSTVFDDATLDTTWRRIVVLGDAVGNTTWPSDAGAKTGITGARDTTIAFFQLEYSPQATEFIWRNDGAQGQRNNDILRLADISPLVSAGRFTFTIEFIPKGAIGDYSVSDAATDIELLSCGNSNAPHLRVQKDTRYLSVKIGGSTWIPAVAMSWNAFDTVEVFVEGGGGTLPSRAYYRRKPVGASAWNAPIFLGTGPVQATCEATGLAGICSDAIGFGNVVFTCWLRKLAAYATGQAPSWVPVKDGNLVIYGNSLVAGQGASVPANAFAQILKAWALSQNWSCTVLGRSGKTTANLLELVQADVDPLYVAGIPNVFFFQEVHNDAPVSNSTTIVQHVKDMLRGRQNVGFSCVSPTIAPYGSVGVDTLIAGFNMSLRANFAGYSSAYVEVASDAFMGDVNNLTYYVGDKTHWTDAGHARVASLVQPVLATVMALPAVTPVAMLPFALPSLRAHYGTAIPKVAGIWRDESPNGQDLDLPNTNPTISMLNGLPALLFDGTANLLERTNFRLGGAAADAPVVQNMSLVVTFELESAGTNPCLASLNLGLNELRASGSTGVPIVVSNSQFVLATTGSVVATKRTAIFTSRYLGPKWQIELFVDGVSYGSVNNATGPIVNVQDFAIGGRVGSTIYANAKIGEVWVCNTELTATERHNLGAAMSAKWATPAVP